MFGRWIARKVWTWERRRTLKRRLARSGLLVLNYGDADRRRSLELVLRVGAETHLGLELVEACQLVMAVERTTKVPGDLAEVGVYRGGSARLICEVKGGRPLHLFDTFEGIPDIEAVDAPHFRKGDWAAPLDQVEAFLRGYPNVTFYKGVFPETAGPVQTRRFSFVHLDVDTRRSTAAALEFFYPRLNPGGVLLAHDYRWAEGVRAAVDAFFVDKPEPVLDLPGSQALIVRSAAATAA